MKLSKDDIGWVQESTIMTKKGYNVDVPIIELDKLREVIAGIENDTQDCFTGLTDDDDWTAGAGFVLKLLRERFGEVLKGGGVKE